MLDLNSREVQVGDYVIAAVTSNQKAFMRKGFVVRTSENNITIEDDTKEEKRKRTVSTPKNLFILHSLAE